MSKATMYPNRAEQPNRDKNSGLQGKCLKAVTRSGNTYEVSCSYQRDPKYHHEWSNVEEIYKGNSIQCGRPSTRFCSHKTYYGIAGYRNTCPIAGISGTYTQPATLRLFFDLEKKGISRASKINKVEVSFEHRCTGVDVANGKETTVWGPNFNGFNIYPNHKPLQIKLGSQIKDFNSNPPLSWKFSGTGTFTFYNVSYNDLNNGIDIIYGNNLETNPGNIYIRNFTINVDYMNGDPYIEGKQSSSGLGTSTMSECRSTILFKLEAGYKQGTKKIPIKDAPKILQKDIIAITEDKNLIKVTFKYEEDNKTVLATLKDNSNVSGEKKVTFKIKGTNESITFKYTAFKWGRPDITIPSQLERNVANAKIVSIIANNGCATTIQAYDNSLDNPLYTFTNLDKWNKENIIPQKHIDGFYKKLAGLDCGYHTIFFKRNNEPTENIISKEIRILPTKYKFEVIEEEGSLPINKYETIQNKSSNKQLILKYVKTKELLENPSFIIKNPTHGKQYQEEGETLPPTNEVIGDIEWNDVNKNGDSIDLPIGTYYPGDYQIKIRDKKEGCINEKNLLKVKITSNHKQHFDEIIVRGEDSTSFDYDYLVALEGDTITEPLYVKTFALGASYKDIKICAKKENITGLSSISTTDFTIKNTSENIIQNVFLELNTLIYNEDGEYEVTSNEWLESDGIFYNFKENFDNFNKDYKDIVSIKNLTPDDDNVDEEDVYIHIEQIKPLEEIKLKIPYGGGNKKKVFLQILLFGNPIPIYQFGHCDDETKTFNLIKFEVYDSILTNMKITGVTDLFTTEIDGSCPKECFTTTRDHAFVTERDEIGDGEDGIKYTIKNIDTNTLEKQPETLITNDPRLVPYKITYKNVSYSLIENYSDKKIKSITIDTEDSKVKQAIIFKRNEVNAIKTTSMSGAKIDVYIKFDHYTETHLHQYTNYDGETEFFIQIPKTLNEKYSIDDILKNISIEYSGNFNYNGTKYTSDEYKGSIRYFEYSPYKYDTKITVIKNQLEYSGGQTIPLKVKLEGNIKYIQNEIIFKPKITKPGSSDSLTVYYKICNLDKNKGKLLTKFETNTYTLIPHEVNKMIYCGFETNLTLDTKLVKIILQNKSLNRLYISLTNKDRDNKNVKVLIEEPNNIKYNIVDKHLDKGEFSVKEEKDKETNSLTKRQMIWEIDYIEEDEIIRGYIDLKSEEIGFSRLKTKVTDFIDNMNPKPKFGKSSYKCDCRKVE